MDVADGIGVLERLFGVEPERHERLAQQLDATFVLGDNDEVGAQAAKRRVSRSAW